MSLYQHILSNFLKPGVNIPEDTRIFIQKFKKAEELIMVQPESFQKPGLLKLMAGIAANIAIEIEEHNKGKPTVNLDKLKQLELEAEAMCYMRKKK